VGFLGGRLRRDRDRGAVASIVVILLASGVLIASVAFSVDLGTLYGERAQLISGANSAALAVAENCVRPAQICAGPTGRTEALDAAKGNAMDNAVNVDSVCGRDLATGRLGPCPSPSGAATHCVSTPAARVNYVEVHTSTLTPDNATVLPPIFSSSFVAGTTGLHVQACSRVTWGVPTGPYAALAIAACRFTALTGGVGSLDPTRLPIAYPSIPSNPLRYETAIRLNAPTSGSGCGGGNQGFAQLNAGGGAGACQLATIAQGANPAGHTDNNDPRPGHGYGGLANCTNLLNSKMVRGSTRPRQFLMIPIYNSVNSTNAGTGAAQFINIIGIAAFQVTGYKLDNSTGINAGRTDWVGAAVPDESAYCGSGTNLRDQCIRGYFVSANVIDGTSPAPGWTRNLALNAFRTDG
jgi:hypothetical protein